MQRSSGARAKAHGYDKARRFLLCYLTVHAERTSSYHLSISLLTQPQVILYV